MTKIEEMDYSKLKWVSEDKLVACIQAGSTLIYIDADPENESDVDQVIAALGY